MGLALLVVAGGAFAAEKNGGEQTNKPASKIATKTVAKSLNKSAAPAAGMSAVPSSSARPLAETYVGYLVDRSCCAMMQQQGKDPVPALKAHFKSCSLEPSCCEAGYAVYSKGRFYDLDAKGNELAKKYFEASKINAGHIVKITGTFRRNELKAESLSQSN